MPHPDADNELWRPKSPWVVVPTYNENDNIEALITELFATNITNLSVLIVDDNSPDGTSDTVRRLQPTYPNLQLIVRQQKAGLGQAYVHGFLHVLQNSADSIVQMDADFSHDPADVLKLLAELATNDLVIGSRYCQGISIVNWPLKRLLLSIAANLYARIITGMPLHDATGGFKAWRATTLQSIDVQSVAADGYGFQIVNNYRTWKGKFRIKEVPIIFTERREGQSKMSGFIIKESVFLVWRLRLLGR